MKSWPCRLAVVAAALCGATAAHADPIITMPHPPRIVWRAEVRPAIAAVTVTAASFLFDSPDRWQRGTDHLLGEGVAGFGNHIGNGFTLTAVAAATYLAGRLRGNADAECLGARLTEGLLTDGAVTLAIKLATRRRRPDGSDRLSFPSGHTSGSFATATILGERFGPRVAWPAYGMAVVVGLSRMEDRRHYFSDVVGGAALGTLIGRLVWERGGIGLLPVTDPNGRCDGLAATIRF